jgi:hypothetical protein
LGSPRRAGGRRSAKPVGSHRIFCLDHLPGQLSRFFTVKLAFAGKLEGKLDDLGLFAGRQLFDFFYQAGCCHGVPLPDKTVVLKGKTTRPTLSIFRLVHLKLAG